MSVYEGGYSERTQPFQTPVWSDSLCAILLRSGWSWDVFWKGGRAAATHQHRRFWAWHEWQVKDPFSCEQIAQECAQVCRAALRLLKATFWTSWTCLVLFVNTQQLRIKRALDLLIWFSILFSLSLSFFFSKFFWRGGWVSWECFSFVTREQDKLLQWHWLWSLWASGAPVKWLTGWKVRLQARRELNRNCDHQTIAIGYCISVAPRVEMHFSTDSLEMPKENKNTCWASGLFCFFCLIGMRLQKAFNYSLKSCDRLFFPGEFQCGGDLSFQT